ncbi:MAG: DUF1345 domain-containing protein [Propionibacterium sp.]|nr:DUF1345 domain-containing protein [Propionibacterium sp.]
MTFVLKKLTDDLVRIYVSTFASLAAVTLGFLPAALGLRDTVAPGQSYVQVLVDELLVPYYLLLWVVGALLYIVLTHVAFTRLPADVVQGIASGQHEKFSWWQKAMGASGAASLSVQAAVMSTLLTLLVSQTDQYRGSIWIITLGLASVAGSWAMMVYSYALHYYRLWASGEAVELDDAQPRFDDFLTLSILTATLHGADTKWRSGRARRSLRTQVVLAFVFNTVVIAMTVSLILR